MINLISTSGIIGSTLLNTLNAIFLWIDQIVYWFISIAFQIFVTISEVSLFNESTIRTIIDRVFTILGVVMLFIMAYEIILLIINPDKATGENGATKLLGKVITSIVLIVLLPTIYKYMQILQYNVISSNVIGNVVIGSSSAGNNDYDIRSSGTSMALTIASAFYHPVYEGNDYTYLSCISLGSEAPQPICQTYISVYDDSLENDNPGGLFADSDLQDLLNLNFWEKLLSNERQMKYTPILSTIAGILAIRMIIAYSLDIGVRVAKLAFLQILAPLPIALNITEKGSVFETKWFKSLKDTYLEIFMKLIVIYFAMFAITLVPEVFSNIFAEGENFIIQSFATVAVILGILQFAKDGPQLLKDLFNMELNISIKKRLGENEYAMRGATAGSGILRGGLQGGFTGAALGAHQGWKLGGDIKDPTKIAGAGRVAASDAMKTKQNIASELDQFKALKFGGYVDKKATERMKDLRGTGTTLFDQSLKAANATEESRNEFSNLLKVRTAVGRAEDARDNQYNIISGSNEGFVKELKSLAYTNPNFATDQFIYDDKNNKIYADGRYTTADGKTTTNDGQFRLAEYIRSQANKSIDKLKIEELKKVLSDENNSKHAGLTSQVKSVITELKENRHLLANPIDKIITAYNSAGEDRFSKTGIKFDKIEAGDLDKLEANLLNVDNADLTVEVMDSKMRSALSDAVVEFKSKRDSASKDTKK